SKCAQEGQVRTISGVTYTCERVNGNLQYAQGRKLTGTLNVLCGAQEAWCLAMTSAFQKKTGITTKFVRLSAGEGLTRLVASKNNPELRLRTILNLMSGMADQMTHTSRLELKVCSIPISLQRATC
ncbi:MAG: hypothetical protein RL421_914, partial [Actinomycetota bacterium]